MASPIPHEDPLAPHQILAGRFRVVRRLAQGGMGIVYEAYDEKLGRRIALKCARASHAHHLTPEVRLATEVNHPNICKIHEIHTAETPAGPIDFFTMEFLEGPTLAQRLRESRLPRAEADIAARQIAAGLAEAHRHGIVHGDLKPANIILAHSPDGVPRAVITDFGLARNTGGATVTGGTPGYMAPEVEAGCPTSLAADVYALGVVLHELATGYRPDQHAAMQATTVTAAPSSSPATAARATNAHARTRWNKIIGAALDPDPARRPPSAEEVLQALAPSTLRRRLVIAASTLGIAALAAFASYQQATTPPLTVRLDAAPVASLGAPIEQALAQIQGTSKTAFALTAARPTHRLTAAFDPQPDGRRTLHATLRDLRSGAFILTWSAAYNPNQLKYAPTALAALVTRTLHLKPPLAYTTKPPAYGQALALLDDDKLDEALASFLSAGAEDPDSALPYAGLAEIYRRRFQVTRADTWRRQAFDALAQSELRNSDVAEVHQIAGMLDFDTGQPQAAIERERRATEFTPPSSLAFRRLGGLYQMQNQLPEALQAFTDARRLAPREVGIYLAIGALYNTRADLENAAATFEAAVQLAPDRPSIRTALAGTYQDQGRFAEAEAQLRTAIGQKESPETLVQLGHLLLYTGNTKAAGDALEKAVALDPSSRSGWLFLGVTRTREHESAAAARAFSRALAIAEKRVAADPRNATHRAVLSYLYAQTGEAARAALEASEAWQLAAGDANVIYYTALAYERAGDRAAALKTLEGAPATELQDLSRWPEAEPLVKDARFATLLAAHQRAK